MKITAKLLLACSILCTSHFESEAMFTKADENFIKRVYSGNPRSSNITTYLYLCRKGNNPLDRCYCFDCYKGKGPFSGLSIGIICADEQYKEFNGFNPETTDNIIWSATLAFYSGSMTGISSGEGDLKSKYHYKMESYNENIDNFIEKNGLIKDDDSFLHQKNGADNYILVFHPESGFLEDNTSELSIVRTLRTALFRWKVDITRLSDFFRKVSKIGEMESGKMIIPKYHSLGKGDRFNCAMVAQRALSELRVGPMIKKEPSSEKAFLFGYAATCIPMAIAGGALIPGGFLVECAIAGVSVLAGMGGGIGVDQIHQIVKNTKANMPEAIINWILTYFKEMYKKADEREKEKINDFFSVVIHTQDEIEGFLTQNQATAGSVPYVQQLKPISEAMKYSVEMGKGKATLFLDEDFRPKSKKSSWWFW